MLRRRKGKGTGPNNFPQRQTEMTSKRPKLSTPSTYIATLLYGSMATLDAAGIENDLKASTGIGADFEPDEGGG